MKKDPFVEKIISSAKDEILIENKHKQIVQGACKLFIEKGFHPTTIREIAEVCDMSMGQLYHYISSKDDVLYLVHKQFHQMQYDLIQNQQLEQFDNPIDRLVHYLKANLLFVRQNKELIQFIFLESKYLEKDYLDIVLKMEKECTIDLYHKLLIDVNEKTPINGDLEVKASIVAYTVPFLTLRGWTVRGKSEKEINKYVLEYIIRGLGIPVPADL